MSKDGEALRETEYVKRRNIDTPPGIYSSPPSNPLAFARLDLSLAEKANPG